MLSSGSSSGSAGTNKSFLGQIPNFLIGEGDKKPSSVYHLTTVLKETDGKIDIDIDREENGGKKASESHGVMENKDSALFLIFSLNQNSGQMCAI